MDQKYPEEYTNKYWDGVFKEAQDELREKFGVKGDAIKLAWNVVFIVCILGLKPPPLGGSFQHHDGVK